MQDEIESVIFWTLLLVQYSVICILQWQVTMIGRSVFCENQAEAGLSLSETALVRLVSIQCFFFFFF